MSLTYSFMHSFIILFYWADEHSFMWILYSYHAFISWYHSFIHSFIHSGLMSIYSCEFISCVHVRTKPEQELTDLPNLPRPPMEMTYNEIKIFWSRIIKAAIPKQRSRFPYAKGSERPSGPSFLPPEAQWVNFLRKYESDIGILVYIGSIAWNVKCEAMWGQINLWQFFIQGTKWRHLNSYKTPEL